MTTRPAAAAQTLNNSTLEASSFPTAFRMALHAYSKPWHSRNERDFWLVIIALAIRQCAAWVQPWSIIIFAERRKRRGPKQKTKKNLAYGLSEHKHDSYRVFCSHIWRTEIIRAHTIFAQVFLLALLTYKDHQRTRHTSNRFYINRRLPYRCYTLTFSAMCILHVLQTLDVYCISANKTMADF